MMKRFEPPLLFAIFLDLIGFGITFPDVQLRAQEDGAPGWMIGGILASYYVVQMVASPRWGTLSDRVGRKRVLILCGSLSALSMLVYALPGHAGAALGILLASRILAGFGAANVVTARAYIADASAGAGQEERAAALGRLSAAVSAGLVLGPVVGGLLASVGGNTLLGLSAAAASALGALWIAIAVPDRSPAPGVAAQDDNEAGGAKSVRLSVGSLTLLRSTPGLPRLFLVAVVGWFAMACLEGTFGRLIHHTLGLGRLEFGLLLGLEAVVAVMQGAFYPGLARRIRPPVLLRVSYALQAVGLALMPFAPNLPLLALLSMLYGMGSGGATPTINAAVSEMTAADRQGEVFGLLQSSRAFGFLIGPILGGALFDRLPAAPYLIAGIVLLLAMAAVRGKQLLRLPTNR